MSPCAISNLPTQLSARGAHSGNPGHAERRLEVEEPVNTVRCASDNDNCDARPGMKSLTMLKIPPKLENFRWRDFRIDIRVLKCVFFGGAFRIHYVYYLLRNLPEQLESN